MKPTHATRNLPSMSNNGFQRALDHIRSVSKNEAQKGRLFELADTGIDLVAEERDGGWCAIQCKCYAPGTRISKRHLDSFISASAREPFELRPHQREAWDDVLAGFRNHDRGKAATASRRRWTSSGLSPPSSGSSG